MTDFPRWHKVVRDIWENKPRTILTVLAITVGVFAFGGMFITRDVLLTNMNSGFANTNPANITLRLSPFEESLIRTVRNFPEVEQVEARLTVRVQIWTGSEWLSTNLIVVPDFSDIHINTLALEQGELTPERREILIERESLPLLDGAALGSTAVVELSDGRQEELTLTGVVHDFNVVPATQVPILTGYVSLDTIRLWGLSTQFDTLQIVAPNKYQTQTELEIASDEIIDRLDRYGYEVIETTITPPGQHWAADFVDAVVLVLTVLGFLALVLSAFLVVNTVMAIVSQQKRQIGVIKALGAQLDDVMGIYLAIASLYGIMALVIALPLGVFLSRGMTHILAAFLNVDIVFFSVPGWIFGLQAAASLITPLLAAAVPVWQGAHTTVREAISDYGISSIQGKNIIDALIYRFKGLPRPVMLSLRNTFRRKARLFLTLVTLSTAGAIFISVLNARTSLTSEFEQVLAMFGFDALVTLDDAEPVQKLKWTLNDVDGVGTVEGWAIMPATIVRPEGVVIQDDISAAQRPGQGRANRTSSAGSTIKEGTAVTIFAPPAETIFITPTMVEGRWLRQTDTYAVVVASEVLGSEPYLQVGDVIKLDLGDISRDFEVVGIVNLAGAELVYAPFETVTRLEGAKGWASAGAFETYFDPNSVSYAVEEHFQQIGIEVNQIFTPVDLIGTITSQIDFFIAFLVFMAILLGIVGSLSLSSTMSLNVLERTREIGVMRAIGASTASIRSIFITEGIIIGMLSFAISILLSLPISYGIVVGLGLIFFDRPLSFQMAASSYGVWLLIVSLLAILASILPANRAAHISVRESLNYE